MRVQPANIHTYIRVCLCKLYLFICGTYISVSHCLYACLSLPSVCRCWRCISPNKIWATWAHLICRSEVIQVHCNPAESWLHRHGYIYIYIYTIHYTYTTGFWLLRCNTLGSWHLWVHPFAKFLISIAKTKVKSKRKVAKKFTFSFHCACAVNLWPKCPLAQLHTGV